MTKKARAVDFKRVRVTDVKVAGTIDVRVTLDADDRALMATAGAWGDADIRLAELATQHALLRTKRAFEATKRKRDRTEATAISADKRDAANHPANEWFALALAEDPNRGMKKLVHAARRLALAAKVEPEERDEITDDRARRFLYRQRNPSQ